MSNKAYGLKSNIINALMPKLLNVSDFSNNISATKFKIAIIQALTIDGDPPAKNIKNSKNIHIKVLAHLL